MNAQLSSVLELKVKVGGESVTVEATPAATVLGGTSGLISLDALQELQMDTSPSAPEFGHTPGGQVSFVRRGGSNVVHGSASDYFRHDAMDAYDWFAK